MRVGGIKVYYSQDDEVIMESPLTWGSNAVVRASARIKISKWSFYMPLELSDFQVNACTGHVKTCLGNDRDTYVDEHLHPALMKIREGQGRSVAIKCWANLAWACSFKYSGFRFSPTVAWLVLKAITTQAITIFRPIIASACALTSRAAVYKLYRQRL